MRKAFEQPPNDTRPMVRWWWFGPAVTKPQLQKQLEAMKKSGFGGFEVQPTYPLALDGSVPGLVNLKFLSPEFLDDLNFVAAKAKESGIAHGSDDGQRLALWRRFLWTIPPRDCRRLSTGADGTTETAATG